MTDTTPKRGRGRPATGRKRLAVSISLQPEEKELLDAVTARYNVAQSDLFRFILNNAWLLTVPAIDLESLRKKSAGDD